MIQRAGRIAMLDSGLGGLTVLAAVRAMTGDADIVYFADTAHVPYGGRSLREVAALGSEIIRVLLAHEPSLILIASGTTCAAFDLHGWPISAVPLIGVVDPGVAAAIAATRNGVIGVVATSATVESGVFERKIVELRPEHCVRSIAAPSLVPIVESGGWASARARHAVALASAPLLTAGCDTVVLGCTHFPHLLASFVAVLGEHIHIVDPGAGCAAKAAGMLLGATPGSGKNCFEVSGNAEVFAQHAKALSGIRIDELRHVELTPPLKPSGII